MPPLVVAQAALIRIVWGLQGTPYAVNVLGARKTGAAIIDQATANAVDAAIKGAFTSSGLQAQVSTFAQINSCGVRDISSPGNAEFVGVGAAVVGTSAANLLPRQVAYCVTLRTARVGKSNRGRIYLPGFGVLQNEPGGTATAAVQTAAAAFGEAVRAALPGQGLTLSIVSRKNLTTEVVTLCQGRDLQWDTIRGRATAGI
jgi:hypothetical protein